MQCGEKASFFYLNPDKGSIFEGNVYIHTDFKSDSLFNEEPKEDDDFFRQERKNYLNRFTELK